MLPTVGSKSLGEEAGVDNGAVRGSEASKGPEDRPYQECTRGGRGRCRATSGRGAGDEVVAAAHGAGAGRRPGAEDDKVGARTSRMRLGRRRRGGVGAAAGRRVGLRGRHGVPGRGGRWRPAAVHVGEGRLGIHARPGAGAAAHARGRASRTRGRGDDVDLKIVICGREGKRICWGVFG